MKKTIGILGVAMIAATMFFSANNVSSSSSDASLVSLMGMNSANAEVPIGNGKCYECGLVSYDVCMTINYKVHYGYLVVIKC
jgi:hypothetical protein